MRVVPRVPPLDRPATYADLESLPDIVVGEIVDGELHASPRPAPRHAQAASALGGRLNPAFSEGDGGPGGWWILNEPELQFGRDVLVPDLAGWRRSRLARLPDTTFFTLAPDWVCEVLSPSTATLDRAAKLPIYAREAVPFAWLIDPSAKVLEVLELQTGKWTIAGTYFGTASVQAVPFEAVAVSLASLFREE